jgi:hypothetical protein
VTTKTENTDDPRRRSLFLSHASEDKPAFVNGLAERLREIHEVWYDEYSLNIGDSIFESISRGLRTCDYGVVVLSQNFFSKKWTRAELDGLFALERAMHKIILPVWLNVSHEDVLNFSPILADRKAALATDGVESVARALDFAIGATAEARDQELGISPISRAAKLNQNTAERERSTQLLDQSEGTELSRKAAQSFLDTAEAAAARLIEVSPALRLSQKGGQAARNFDFLNIYGPNGLIERFEYHATFSNSANRDRLGIYLCRFTREHEEQNKPATKMSERSFVPFITLENKVLWKGNDGLHDSSELIESALSEFVDQLEKEQKLIEKLRTEI